MSAASHWEVAIKASLGKLQLGRPFRELFDEESKSNGIRILTIELAHSDRVFSLPFHHRDPFDRMLISQSLVEQMPLVSRDAQFDAYGVTRLW